MSFRRWPMAVAALALTSPAFGQETLSLEDALARAGLSSEAGTSPPSDNPRLIGPVAEADAAQARIDQARLRPNPQLSLEVEDFAGSGAFTGLRASEYTLAIGQQFELGGKRSARIEAAEALASVAITRTDLARADLALFVRTRYLTAVASEARLKLAAEVVERNRELARIAQALVDAGREPPLRSMRAQAALAEAEADEQAARAASTAARTALFALWSDEAGTAPIPSTFPAIAIPSDEIGAESGLSYRLARDEREAARAMISRERSLGVPDPTFSAGIRQFEESGDTAFIVGVSIPLPFSNRNQGNILAAEAELRAATAREAVVLAELRQRIAQARSDYLAADSRVETLSQASLPQAEEALRLVQIGYRSGRFPLIEVLNTAEARDAIRASLIEAQEERGRAAALLIRLATQFEGADQ